MTKQEVYKKYPFVYSYHQLKIIDTSDFPPYYVTPDGPVFPESFFNGSILRKGDRLIFCCRADQMPWFEQIRLIVCDLDFDFKPKKETIKFLQIGSDKGYYHVEDPRLFLVGDDIHLIYGDGFKVYHAELTDDLTVKYWNNITNFGIKGLKEHDLREKNWAPFEYNGSVAVIYCDEPRVIYFPYTGKIVLPDQKVTWEYGQIRGGTPAIKWKKDYITFFHSALNDDGKSWHSGRTYFAGAYVFDAHPPFRVKAITKIPLIKGTEIIKNPIAPKVRVVFPAGIAESFDSFYVSMGFNDCRNGILRVSKFLLENILISV